MESKRNTELHAVRPEDELDEPAPGSWRFGRVIRELRQRKVCRAAITYVLILWLNLQIGDVLFPMMGFPDWTLQLTMLIGMMGFPVVLLLAWLFQITPQGVVLDISVPQEETAFDRYVDRTVSLLLLALSFALTLLLAMQFMDFSAQLRSVPPGLCELS